MTLKFTCDFNSTFSVEWPKIKIIHNQKVIKTHVCDKNMCEFFIVPQKINLIEIHYFNKTEKHTIVRQGKILSDQSLELKSVYVDDVLLDNWFITNGLYYPEYFKGFLKDHAKQRINEPLPVKIKSQKIWHFPGKFKFESFSKNFYDWYFNKMNNYVEINFMDKDPLRVDKFKGSLDPHKDIVDELKKYL